jgi:Rha family phage regulatory protein|nr:MAG TPA: regulatory protein [Caudoviricetes sp.]
MDCINEMNNLVASIDVKEYEGQPVVSSREVANNFEKQHKHVLESIENIKAENSAVTKMFIESSYKAGTGKNYKEYLLTRDGFSLLVMGFTGAKALQWKLKYIEAFNKMEEKLKNLNPYTGISKELQAIFVIDKKQQQIEQNVNEVKQDLKNFKDNAPLFNIECDTLQKALRGKVIKELGGKNSLAYKDKSIRTKIYIDAQNQLKREFAVQSYKAIKRCQLEDALEVINTYKVPTVYKDLIDAVNRQILLENVVM